MYLHCDGCGITWSGVGTTIGRACINTGMKSAVREATAEEIAAYEAEYADLLNDDDEEA